MKGFGFLKKVGAILSAIVSPMVTMSCHSNEAKDLYGPPSLDDADITYSADILHEGIEPVDDGRENSQASFSEEKREVDAEIVIQDEARQTHSLGVETGEDKKGAPEEVTHETKAVVSEAEQASSEEKDNLDVSNAEATNRKIKVLKKSSKKCPACGVYGPPTPRRHL